MDWWMWLVLVLVIAALAVGGLLALQARPRRGGVIVGGSAPRRKRGSS